MKKLKILHTESSIGWGGQEIRILTEMQVFKDTGHDVAIATIKNCPIGQEAQKRGFRVLDAQIERKNLKGLLCIRKILASEDFDVVNTHSSTDSWLVALASKITFKKISIVRTRHVSTGVSNNFATMWLYKSATKHIVITGEALRQKLILENNINPQHITSVPTGIDLSYYKPLDKQKCKDELGIDSKKVIGIVATLRDWKGHDYLLDAFDSSKENLQDWQILIVGDGPRMEHLKNKVANLKLEQNVMFVGNQSNIPQWLACFDIFVLPSYGEEGVPQSIMQAMACGVPVISTTVGAIREIVNEDQMHQTGIIVEPRDAKMLSSAILQLACDEELRLRLSKNAISTANERFGSNKMLHSMELIFNANKN